MLRAALLFLAIVNASAQPPLCQDPLNVIEDSCRMTPAQCRDTSTGDIEVKDSAQLVCLPGCALAGVDPNGNSYTKGVKLGKNSSLVMTSGAIGNIECKGCSSVRLSGTTSGLILLDRDGPNRPVLNVTNNASTGEVYCSGCGRVYMSNASTGGITLNECTGRNLDGIRTCLKLVNVHMVASASIMASLSQGSVLMHNVTGQGDFSVSDHHGPGDIVVLNSNLSDVSAFAKRPSPGANTNVSLFLSGVQIDSDMLFSSLDEVVIHNAILDGDAALSDIGSVTISESSAEGFHVDLVSNVTFENNIAETVETFIATAAQVVTMRNNVGWSLALSKTSTVIVENNTGDFAQIEEVGTAVFNNNKYNMFSIFASTPPGILMFANNTIEGSVQFSGLQSVTLTGSSSAATVTCDSTISSATLASSNPGPRINVTMTLTLTESIGGACAPFFNPI